MFRSIVLGIFIIGISATAMPADAQEGFAVVDVEYLMVNSDRGKEIQQQLQREFSGTVETVRGKEQALSALRTKIADQANTLSAEALEPLRREFEDGQLELQRLSKDLERNVQKRQGELFQILEKDVIELLATIRREKGLEGIFDRARSGLLVAEPSMIITDEVMVRLNTAQ